MQYSHSSLPLASVSRKPRLDLTLGQALFHCESKGVLVIAQRFHKRLGCSGFRLNASVSITQKHSKAELTLRPLFSPDSNKSVSHLTTFCVLRWIGFDQALSAHPGFTGSDTAITLRFGRAVERTLNLLPGVGGAKLANKIDSALSAARCSKLLTCGITWSPLFRCFSSHDCLA